MSGRKNRRGRGSGNPQSPESLAGRGRDSVGLSVAAASTPGLTTPSPNIQTIGVRRPDYGKAGIAIPVTTNHFLVKLPSGTIHHYDAMMPSEQKLPLAMTTKIMQRLQDSVAPDVFTPRVVYDGRKNVFAIQALSFEQRTFDVSLDYQQPGATATARGPKVYKVTLTKVADINLEFLSRFLEGNQSFDSPVQTAIAAFNVVLKMEPNLHWPFNKRAFFTNQERKDIGNGIVLWRGFFQSIRPVVGRMLVNVDITTGAMYKGGPLPEVCTGFLNTRTKRYRPQDLAPSRSLSQADRSRLQHFLKGAQVITTNANGQKSKTPKTIKGLSRVGADSLTFTHDGAQKTVAQYFEGIRNRPLTYPHILCVEVGRGALVPLEMCEMPEGQIMRKEIPDDKLKDVLSFASKGPKERLQSIRSALGVLGYGQSEYVRQFGLHVEEQEMMTAQARMLSAPGLKCGENKNITPNEGTWNMVNRKLYRPKEILRWCVAVFERQESFGQRYLDNVVNGFMSAAGKLGMRVHEGNPIVEYINPQGDIIKCLKDLGGMVARKHTRPNGPPLYPTLMVVVLPEHGNEIYRTVKYFGDTMVGIATQCMKASECNTANIQYYSNICLKVNGKLGGVNFVLDRSSAPAFNDPQNPTIVMGADVMHPSPGVVDRPSYASVVASVDVDATLYTADCRVQRARLEMIADLRAMVKSMLARHMAYRGPDGRTNKAPKRLIFFRDGVSESQFQETLEFELREIQAACTEAKVNASITFIVVRKRHHVRFFPKNETHSDKGGNCKAGLVVDRDVTHPLEFEFYLQSHSGMLSLKKPAQGTTRPAFYNVLHDDNKFTPDALQGLAYALCHVYERSTRSVSIPAPVYYADLVCARAKNHYGPGASAELAQTESQSEDDASRLDWFQENFKPLHADLTEKMYFM